MVQLGRMIRRQAVALLLNNKQHPWISRSLHAGSMVGDKNATTLSAANAWTVIRWVSVAGAWWPITV
jgi:hypothetical protein